MSGTALAGQPTAPAADALPVGSIRFEGVSKRYHIVQRAAPRLGSWVLNKAFEHFRREPFDALSGVSFEIQPGEMVGLLGPNGAGKSTILKLIAGISEPTSGRVTVSGPVTSMLELGVGFHPELTGMENIFYNAALMGMPRARVLEKLGVIIAFSGLEKFLYEPVKHYSSGMYSRLACSVALHLDPEIILVDEILAVGDAEFQQRGILKILELHERGVTTLLVTHETATASELCGRLIWIERGAIVRDGEPLSVHREYLRHMNELALPPETVAHARSGEPPICDAWVEVDGARTAEVGTDSPAAIVIALGEGLPPVRVAIRVRWSDGRILCEDMSPPLSGAKARWQIPRWPLINESAEIDLGVQDAATGEWLDRRHGLLHVRTTQGDPLIQATLVQPRMRWSMQRLGSVEEQRGS